MTLYQKIEEMLYEHASTKEGSSERFWKRKAQVMEEVTAIEKSLINLVYAVGVIHDKLPDENTKLITDAMKWARHALAVAQSNLRN